MTDGRTPTNPWFGWLVAGTLLLVAGGVFLKVRPSLPRAGFSAEQLGDDLARRLPRGSDRQQALDWLASHSVPANSIHDFKGTPSFLFVDMPGCGWAPSRLSVVIDFDADDKVAGHIIVK